VKLNSIGKTFGTTVSAAAIAALALAGCGSDNNAGTSGSNGGGDTGAAAAGSAEECGGKNTLTAEGSSAQQNAMAVFAQTWGQVCQGKNISYNPTGSGAGREQFAAGNVDIGGSDSPIKEEQAQQAAQRCNGNEVWNLPLVFGPVAMAYNVEGVEGLVLNADVIAQIFQGGITNWNDPAIAALNEGKTLPDQGITPIYRSDSSGTTDNFQLYLEAAAPEAWTKGSGSEFQGGAGEGAQKSSGVVQAVQATPGSIGYVEKGFADQAGLPAAQIDNGSGAVELNNDSAGKAIDAATFAGEGNNLVLDLQALYGTTEEGAYPLVLATYSLVCSNGYPAETAEAVKSFLTVASHQGQAGLPEAGYVPLPERFTERLQEAIDGISATA